MRYLICVFLFAGSAAAAQRVTLDSLDVLAGNAGSTTAVDLPQDMLSLAGPFLGEGSEEAVARELLANIEGMYVRVFEDLVYSGSDLDAVRAQLVGTGWTRMVTVDEDEDEIGIWMYRDGDAVTGMFILVAEPDEVVAVNIVGRLDPEDLAALGGRFGVPALDFLQ